MKRNIILTIAMVLLMITAQACSENSTAPDLNLSNSMEKVEAENSSVQLIAGTIDKTERQNENGIDLWEVNMTTSSGGKVKVKYIISNGQLFEIEGYAPSFEYEVEPGNSMIKYSSAKSIALNTKMGTIEQWKLSKDESDNKWEYRFWIATSDKTFRIEIDAATGSVTKVE